MTSAPPSSWISLPSPLASAWRAVALVVRPSGAVAWMRTPSISSRSVAGKWRKVSPAMRKATWPSGAKRVMAKPVIV